MIQWNLFNEMIYWLAYLLYDNLIAMFVCFKLTGVKWFTLMLFVWYNFISKYTVNENDVLFKGMRLWKSVNETEMSMKHNVNETERFLALRSMGMTLVFQVL